MSKQLNQKQGINNMKDKLIVYFIRLLLKNHSGYQKNSPMYDIQHIFNEKGQIEDYIFRPRKLLWEIIKP